MFIIQINSHNNHNTISSIATYSPFPELKYIEPGKMLVKVIKKLKKDQKEDIPFIRLPSFSPTFLATVEVKQETLNTNSKNARWNWLTALANTTLTSVMAEEAAQEAA